MSDTAARLSQVQKLLSQGKPDAAQAELRRALQKEPANPHLNNAMALTLLAMERHEQALFFLTRALEARPDDPALLVNLGRTLGTLKRPDEALARFARATEVAPNMIEAREGLAHMLRLSDRLTDAADQLRLALASHPDDPALASMYTGLLMHLARVPDAAAFARAWLARHPHLRVAGSYAAAMTYHPDAAPQDVFEAQAAYGRLLESTVPPAAPHTNDPTPDRPLRIGLLSHELRRHAVATFLEGWLQHHDRASVHIICYSTAALEDDVTARLKKSVEGWANAAPMNDAAIAQRIRADRTDILVETTGITDGQRLGVMALRPAPIQVSFIGYLNTTGLRSIDYRIADAHTEPPGSEQFSTERIARIEPTYWCYRPADDAPQPARTPGPLTFGSFNTASKLNDRVIALWARILAATPQARLLLKAYDFADARLRADLDQRFARHGVDPTRVELEGPTHGMGAFLANYNRIDIGLDPFPFNGTTTTLDALWMGVPVITLAGRTHAGRTGVSILSALGLPDLIAADETEYVRIAAALAANTPRRDELRRSLRARIAASALGDAPAFAARVDAALRGMWREWCAARPRV